MAWFDGGLVLIGGLALGILLMIAGRFSFAVMQDRSRTELAAPVSGVASPQLLLAAKTDLFEFRASSIDLQQGSDLMAAIMKGLPAEVKAFEQMAPTMDLPPKLIDITYQRLASAGPVTSLVRTERIVLEDDTSSISYATSLFNELKPDGIHLRDFFQPGIFSKQSLNTQLCNEIRKQKAIRLGGVQEINCARYPKADAFDGAPVAFVASNEDNLFGGMRFYFKAGDIGDPAEGMYIITLRQSAFREELKPAYRSLFGGTPAQLAS